MSIKAGTTLTTAHLSHSTLQTNLTDDSASSSGSWERWGTEEITFSDPGIAIEVSAVLLGRLFDNTNGDVAGTCRLRISLDGGSSWTNGTAPFVRVGTSVGLACTVGNTLAVSGTPSGDIIVQAELRVNDTATEARDGTITATMIPAA